MLELVSLGWLTHISDYPGAPPLNASNASFSALASSLEGYFLALRAGADSWEPLGVAGPGDIQFRTHRDEDSGCPWIFATAELSNCTIESSARVIVTELEQYQRLWDKKLLSSELVRSMPLANGSQSVHWFSYSAGPLLSHRGYYSYGAWRWDTSAEKGGNGSKGVLTSPSASISSDVSAPSGSEAGVRMAGRQWKRLSASSPTSTRYEVLQLSDIFGLVPCGITLSGQASVLTDEINAYRELIPPLGLGPSVSADAPVM